MGHYSFPVLKRIKDLSSTLSCNFDSVCSICPLVEQQSLPFHKSNSYAANNFDLVHFDVWGPYHHPIINKCKFSYYC